jgi:hypothetical protein
MPQKWDCGFFILVIFLYLWYLIHLNDKAFWIRLEKVVIEEE